MIDQQKLVYLHQYAELEKVGQRVLVCPGVEPAELLRLAVDLKVCQVVQETSPYFEGELQSAVQMLDSPKSFFEFPLSTVFSPTDISSSSEARLLLLERRFSESTQKEEILDAIEEIVSSYASPRSLVADVRLVADELFVNAIYNAPVNKSGIKIGRTEIVKLEKPKEARIMLGAADDCIALVCEDPFGSLEIRKFLARILKCYDEGPRKVMNFGVGGAGVGSFLIYNSCKSLYLGVQQDQRTVFAVVFALGKGCRARQELSKSIHYIGT